MWMPHLLENSDFTIDSVNIALIFDLVFFKYLDGDFISSDNMGALLHFPECSFSFRFTDDEPTNLLAFAVLLLLWTLSILLLTTTSFLLRLLCIRLSITPNCLFLVRLILILNFLLFRHLIYNSIVLLFLTFN